MEIKTNEIMNSLFGLEVAVVVVETLTDGLSTDVIDWTSGGTKPAALTCVSVSI